ncbi:AraC family transcriptional regulator [Streptomyces sp. AP-93]|uniref:AraC family transcriptional regulator n=1 Tax=Streptomyces sp. AP-93 TaxID=2929048 RepID=UPI001FAEED76|nr:AraC family transcriptional regulator [Streptomyces sp. AP-93]MCJ0867895.1 AraC family transcriptional regulator [Streptomyces sp. AP-93]
MDVLSDVIALMRTGRPTSALVRWHAPWGQRFPAVPGSAGFQVVLSGSCLLATASEPVRLNAGDVLFLPHGHGYTLLGEPSAEPAEPRWEPDREPALLVRDTVGEPGAGPVTVTLCGGYRIEAEHAHPLLRELPEVLHLPGGQPGAAEAVALLAREAQEPGLGTDTLLPALLDVLLLYVLRAHVGGVSGPGGAAGEAGRTGWAAALVDPAVGAALAAIHAEPDRPWTVASLGARAGLSRAAFARRFHERVGQPPLAYLTWWRMTTAARLLRTTDTPLSVLAARSGYTSEYSFAHAFKRTYGIPPGRYRGGRRDEETT